MKVLVDGGAGYVGSLLVPRLLDLGYDVRVYDIGWFGNEFLPHGRKGFEYIEGDIRDAEKYGQVCEGMDAVIHLACVSNDNSCQLDEALSTTINFDAFEPMVIAAKKAGVKRFIYCSSSSVYGSSDAENVTEDHPLIPLTLYNKFKGLCEPILLKYRAVDFVPIIVRPATVCGPAPRMRFDLTANILTMHAVKKRVITVFGGQQKRPNLHIVDMCRLYERLLVAPAQFVDGQIFNFGHDNLTVLEIAQRAKGAVEAEYPGDPVRIDVQERQDNRSYHINSDKIRRVLGLVPKHSVGQAIREICKEFHRGRWPDALTNPNYTNVVQLMGKGLGRHP